MTRVLVCGGRNFTDRTAVFQTLDLIDSQTPITLIIEGGASGADQLAAAWARCRNRDSICFRADWKKHGISAGPIRNKLMLDDGKPDMVVAFPGGRGTENMVMQATRAGFKVHRA